MQPFLHPERAPAWDATRRASYEGLRAEHTRAHLARAALEGVGRQLGAVVACLEAFVGPATAVKATGGALRAPLWREVVVDALGRPIEVVDDVGGTALGAACLGLVGVGRAPDLAAARESLTGGDRYCRTMTDPAASPFASPARTRRWPCWGSRRARASWRSTRSRSGSAWVGRTR